MTIKATVVKDFKEAANILAKQEITADSGVDAIQS